MFVTDQMIREMADRYGEPAVREFDIPATPDEVRRIVSSQKNGRNHDVTLYVHKGDEWIVIAKHPYPEGLFRSPSGGVHPGETMLEGINREVAEELGCEIELEKFLLVTSVRFHAVPGTTGTDLPTKIDPSVPYADEVHWRSFVFLARYLRGDFAYTDTEEIRELRLVPWEKFAEFGAIMRKYGSGGLRYRAQLHETVAELLGR